MSDQALISVIIDVATALFDAHHELGATARKVIMTEGRLSAAMSDWALRTTCRRYSAQQVAFCARAKDLMNRRVFVVLAESVPTAPLRAIVLPLLRGASRVTVRPHRTEPGFARLVVDAFAQRGLRVSLCTEQDAEAFVNRAIQHGHDTCIAYGHDTTLRSIRDQLPGGVRFEGHGHGFGVSLVCREASEDEGSVECVARDVAHYDQKGCLSPQTVFVQSDHAVDFGHRLCKALDRLDQELPRGPLSEGDAARIMQWQGAMAATGAELIRCMNNSIAVFENTKLITSPGLRNVAVCPVALPDEVSQVLQTEASHLTCVGIAGDPARWKLPVGSSARFVAAGTMQDPPLDGSEDPRPVLRYR